MTQGMPVSSNKTLRGRQKRRGRPRKADEQDVTERLLDAATELFLSCGYGETSMDMVATRACSSKRTLYVRYPSKPELFRAFVERFARVHLEGVELSTRDVDSTEQALCSAGREILKLGTSRDVMRLHRILAAEAEAFPELALIIDIVGWQPAIALIEDILRKAKGAALLDTTDLKFLSEQFFALVMGNVFIRIGGGLSPSAVIPDPDDHVRRSVELFLNGCGLK